MKVWAKHKTQDSHFMFLRVQESAREWTLTLPSELPLWELESQWTHKFSEGNYRGQNSLDGGVTYIIGKLLELRCLKWVCMTHLNIWHTSYSQKKGRKSNWQIDSRPLNIGNHPDFLVFRWHATYHWNDLNKGYNFASDLILIRRLHIKLWASMFMGVLVVGISGLPFGSPGTKWHLGASPMAKHIVH